MLKSVKPSNMLAFSCYNWLSCTSSRSNNKKRKAEMEFEGRMSRCFDETNAEMKNLV